MHASESITLSQVNTHCHDSLHTDHIQMHASESIALSQENTHCHDSLHTDPLVCLSTTPDVNKIHQPTLAPAVTAARSNRNANCNPSSVTRPRRSYDSQHMRNGRTPLISNTHECPAAFTWPSQTQLKTEQYSTTTTVFAARSQVSQNAAQYQQHAALGR